MTTTRTSTLIVHVHMGRIPTEGLKRGRQCGSRRLQSVHMGRIPTEGLKLTVEAALAITLYVHMGRIPTEGLKLDGLFEFIDDGPRPHGSNPDLRD